jgi:broad specificity phosphatase PhoE
MTMVTWARHGENLANVTGTLSFRVYDESLTGRGCQQARDLAARLAAGPVPDRIVCSPPRRAAETAAILARALGTADVTADENLREVNVGSLDGRNDARSWDTYNSVLDAWRHGDYAARAALPLLAAAPEPGQDLPTGGTARFVTSPGDPGIRLCLLSWAG